MMPVSRHRLERKASLEELLIDLYDRRPSGGRCRLDSDTCTDDVSMLSDYSNGWRSSHRDGRSAYTEAFLIKMDVEHLNAIVINLKANITEQSQLLVRYLKRRDQLLSKVQVRCNVVTAVLQAMSPKRRVDAKLQFTPDPPPTENGYEQWLNAMKAVARLPDGMPAHFRQKLWLTLADHYVKTAEIDWEETKRFAFNDRMNPDDDELSLQIVKDLHRTGWSGLDGDKERVLLRRVLLAYARYNKTIGYCQGFNVIAALILEITEYREEQALKVMIMLIENVLPSGYFDQTLRALSVDMAVLRDLMRIRLPKLSAHLDFLQQNSDSEFEPPLINVFSMQWFLTLFATCLPKHAVHRVWDSLMLEGSEILLRAALALWSKIGKRVNRVKSADAFYCLMGTICQELTEMTPIRCDELMRVMYTMAEFPYPGLDELRDKYMWNIQPFSTAFRLFRQQAVSILKSDVEDSADGHCNILQAKHGSPNVEGDRTKMGAKSNLSATDLGALEKQYKLLRQRQKQAAIILQNAITKGKSHFPSENTTRHHENGEMFNHLYLSDSCRRPVPVPANGCLMPVAPKAIQPSGRAKGNNRESDRSSRRTSVTSTTSTMKMLESGPASPTTPLADNAWGSDKEFQICFSKEHFSPSSGNNQRRSKSLETTINRENVQYLRKYRSCWELCQNSENFNFWHLDFGRKIEKPVVKKKKVRPPPLVLGSASATAQLIRPVAMETAKSSTNKHKNAQLEKSKAILNSLGEQARISDQGQNNYNPFPTKRQTTLIERGKRLGLYS